MADRWFWRRAGGCDYRGRLKDWPEFIADYLQRQGVTDLVLNGEQREYHKAAIRCARARGVHVTVTDFGYLRSDWITIERNGMSGHSEFPRNPETIRRLAENVPKCDFGKKYEHRFWDMVGAEIIAAGANTFGGIFYPRYETHHMYSPLRCGFFTAKRKLKAKFFGAKTKRLITRRIEEAAERPFFLFPMQLEADAQLQAYSHYPDMETPIREIMESFTAHAPKKCRLMIKVHPLDPGVVDWQSRVREHAIDLGVSGRVDYVDVGLLDDIIRASSGIVTINSTVGIIGLRFERPVKTLGQAIYDIPGITFQGALDAFWTASDFMDMELCKAYLRALGGCLHVRGTYYNKAGVLAAAQSAAARLHYQLVNQPADPEFPAV